MKHTFVTKGQTKTVSIPDKEIQYLMDKYKLSKDEAIYTWLVDEDYVTDPRVEELEKKAKENKVSRDARALKPLKTERKTREKKENPLKKAIILSILEGLNGYFGSNGEISVRNDEKYIDICFENRNFTINLVEHRVRESD